jgi:hypothetical protein
MLFLRITEFNIPLWQPIPTSPPAFSTLPLVHLFHLCTYLIPFCISFVIWLYSVYISAIYTARAHTHAHTHLITRAPCNSWQSYSQISYLKSRILLSVLWAVQKKHNNLWYSVNSGDLPNTPGPSMTQGLLVPYLCHCPTHSLHGTNINQYWLCFYLQILPNE